MFAQPLAPGWTGLNSVTNTPPGLITATETALMYTACHIAHTKWSCKLYPRDGLDERCKHEKSSVFSFSFAFLKQWMPVNLRNKTAKKVDYCKFFILKRWLEADWFLSCSLSRVLFLMLECCWEQLFVLQRHITRAKSRTLCGQLWTGILYKGWNLQR